MSPLLLDLQKRYQPRHRTRHYSPRTLLTQDTQDTTHPGEVSGDETRGVEGEACVRRQVQWQLLCEQRLRDGGLLRLCLFCCPCRCPCPCCCMCCCRHTHPRPCPCPRSCRCRCMNTLRSRFDPQRAHGHRPRHLPRLTPKSFVVGEGQVCWIRHIFHQMLIGEGQVTRQPVQLATCVKWHPIVQEAGEKGEGTSTYVARSGARGLSRCFVRCSSDARQMLTAGHTGAGADS